MIRFRPIAPEDDALLFRIYASTRVEELARLPWTDEQKQALLAQQFHAQHSHYRQYFAGASFLIVLDDDRPVGRLYVDRGEREIRIIDLVLLPEHRGRGLGSRLLEEIIAEGADSGRPITIHVEEFNPARQLYRRLGFHEVERTNGIYFRMEWTPPTSDAGADAGG